jgi:ABC-type amino acid transport substrate-binding protein
MKRKLCCILLVIIPLFFLSCNLASQEEQEQLSELSPLETVRLLAEDNRQFESSPTRSTENHAPEIRSILDRGYIVFAMTSADQKPFFYSHPETGELIGLDVEIAYSIANLMGVKAVFNRDASSFDGAVQEVIHKRADIALSKLSLTIRRVEIVRFTNPYIIFRQALLINRLEFAKIGSEDYLPYFIRNFQGPLGVIVNSSYMNFAYINFPGADVKTYNDWDETVDALFRGEVLAVYRDEGEILRILNTKEGASILMKPVIISDKRDPIAMAVSTDAPLLQSWLNVFLDDYLLQRQREMTPSRLIERHFGR